MSITREQLKNIVKETLKEESEYQVFFRKALEKAGKSIPSMSDEEKKEFFNKIDKAWNGKGEKNEGNAFGAAVVAAKEKGEDEFEVDGKTYKVESVVNEDANMNKKVKQLLDKNLKELTKGKPNHQFAVMHILMGALSDANFHSEAKKVAKLFPRAKYEGDPMAAKDVEEYYHYELGPDVANICKWDGKDIVMAMGFYVSMTIGRPVGEKVEKLVESVNESASCSCGCGGCSESVNEARTVSKPIKVDDDTMVQIVGDNKGFRELTAALNPKTGKPIQKFGYERGNEIADSKEELIKKLQKKYGKSIKFESVNERLTNSDVKRMEGLHSYKKMDEALKSLVFIGKELYEEGFEKPEITEFILKKVQRRLFLQLKESVKEVHLREGMKKWKVDFKHTDGRKRTVDIEAFDKKRAEGRFKVNWGNDMKILKIYPATKNEELTKAQEKLPPALKKAIEKKEKNESVNEGYSTEEKRIVMMAVRKIAKYMNVDLETAMNYVLGAGQELERDIKKGKIKK